MKKHLISFGIIFMSIVLFQHCCLNQVGHKNSDEKEPRKNIIKPFPRGIIEASITPINITVKNDKYFCEATINKIHNIGGGIRPIAESTEYTFEIEYDLIDDFQAILGNKTKCRIAEVPAGMNSNMVSRKYKIVSKSKE
jgi:hypothetical protein